MKCLGLSNQFRASTVALLVLSKPVIKYILSTKTDAAPLLSLCKPRGGRSLQCFSKDSSIFPNKSETPRVDTLQAKILLSQDEVRVGDISPQRKSFSWLL